MRRLLRWGGWLVAALLGLPLLLLAALLLALNLPAGQRQAAQLVNRLAGGSVSIDGLGGGFPASLRIGRIGLRDADGEYAVIHGAALDWSPFALLHRDLRVTRLAAARIDVLRLPVAAPATETPSSSTSSFSLPVRVDLDALRIDRLVLAAPVAGATAELAVAGSAHVADLTDGSATLALRRLDAPGTYRVTGRIDPARVQAALAVEEPEGGFIAAVAKLPGLGGSLTVQASVDGPWQAARARAHLAAGPLRLAAEGQIDIPGQAGDLALTADAPAMAPRPGVSWQSVAIAAHVRGQLAHPVAHATVRIAGLAAAGAAVRTLAVALTGDTKSARLDATADGVEVPGPKPDLLAAAPLTLHAAVDLADPARPVRFTLAHTLLTLAGRAQTAGAMQATAHLDLPDLAPLAAAGGVALTGHAAFDLTAAESDAGRSATLDGTIGLTGGMAPLPALLGPAARIGVSAAMQGDAVTLSRLQLDGQTVTLAAHGSRTAGGVLSLDWQATLADLSALAATVQGRMAGHGHVAGPADDLAAQATLTGEVATQGVPRGPLSVTLAAQGLPARPTGHVRADGELDGAPLSLDASAARDADGTLHLAIAKLAWKSAAASGTATLPPGAVLPLGHLSAKMTRLADLAALTGAKLAGSVAAEADLATTDGRPTARLTLDARDAGLAGIATVGSARMTATVRDPATDPAVAAALDLTGLRVGTLGGTLRLTAEGRQSALALRLSAAVQNLMGADVQASGNATLDVPGRSLALAALQADWKGESLRLLGPARVQFANGVAVDRLRLGLQQAVVELAGRLSPTLDLTAALRNVTADLARPFLPDMAAQGVLNAEARITGTASRPSGTVRVRATGLHLASGPAAGLPPAEIAADATLAGRTAEIDAHLSAGRNALTLTGTAPIDPAAAMQLRAAGALDLATLNPLLTASGRHVLGRVTLDATATGTLSAPRAAGTLRLAGGDVQDYALGAHVTGLSAVIEADGDHVRIASLTGRAGQGTLGAAGSVGLGGTMPVDLTLTAKNARPLASDRLTATLDADLTLQGELLGALAAGGTVKIDRAEIRIPNKLPASIAVLDVRRPGQKPPPPPTPGPDIALNVTVVAPGEVFVRGRGLFAEVAGRIHVGGTAAKPVPVGEFRLRRGEFDLAGTTLTFTSGDVRFLGSGSLDPTLNLVASSTTANYVATLTVGGFASAPKITLSSTPPLPQDEILAQLLFHQSAGSLSPVQLASAAAALAQISGVGGGVFDPLNGLRQQLGLDRLTVGGGQNGTGPSVEAGRYVAQGVYVGAKQSADGNGSQATVQIDLLRGLKLETDVGTGTQTSATGAAATADPYGTSVGLTYQFQY